MISRPLVLFFLLFSSVIPHLSATASEKDYKNFSNVSYISNYDGDTITFDIPGAPDIVGKNMAIRIRGIDTPELKSSKCQAENKMALQAKNRVRSLLQKARTINLRNITRGKYFRFIADVEFDEKDLGQLLLKEKLAIEYFGGTRDHDWCKSDYSAPVSIHRDPAITPPMVDGIYVWPPPPAQPRQ